MKLYTRRCLIQGAYWYESVRVPPKSAGLHTKDFITPLAPLVACQTIDSQKQVLRTKGQAMTESRDAETDKCNLRSIQESI